MDISALKKTNTASNGHKHWKMTLLLTIFLYFGGYQHNKQIKGKNFYA